ncbi:hypothetical protein QFZ37_002152 [Chryseobacterium ginsenosidimutans]|uniref:fibronectin type III domain-containing protein n=1 Tax=Chryseobacterium ginsenosidimutans TaxID=687846 RepID=UPI00278994E5|nr:T9SS type A sorting domain-containing protein [Chryseobacterium ginsenosidimutans]MDQ0593783.1 hypothetical protein [Chryseobacterium ginsenosidimutans]
MKKLLLTYLLLIGTLISAQITLGSGTTSGGTSTSVATVPWSTYYGYSYAQQILSKANINADAAGNITGLKFYLGASSVITNSSDVVVYLGLTNKDSFSSTTDWIPTTSLTQVFSGTVTNNAGVVEITFPTPFAYDNVNNLVIAVDENKSGDDGGERFYTYSNGTNKTLYYRNDTTNPNPASITQTGTRSATQSVVTLVGLTPSVTPTCPSVSAPAAAATGVSITPAITWGAISNATGYKLSIGTTAGGTDVLNNADLGNVLTYTPTTPLNYNKQYFYTVNAYNGAIPSAGCSERSFTTLNIPCPTVSAPASAATGVSLTPTITWAATTGATGYKLRVGTTAGGTDIVNNADLGNVTSYTFSSPLLNSTKYYYTVNSYDATTTSASCTERNFTTICGVLSAPFLEAFSSGSLPSCWSNSSTNNAGYALWQFGNGTQDYGTTNNGSTAGTFAYVDASSPYTGIHDVTLQSPQINLTGLVSPMVQFKWFKNHLSTATGTTQPAYDNNKLTVQVRDIATSTWETIFTDTSNSSVWRTQMITLSSSYVGKTIELRFIVDKDVAGNGYFYDNLLLDDVQVKETPSCVEPSALAVSLITSSSATLSWTAPAPAPANGYEYYYSTTNTAPTSGTATTATTVNFSPLSPSTTYYYWVRSMCGGSQSTWVTGSFATPAIPPANDNCANPVALTVGTDFASGAITATNAGATADGTAQSCQSSATNNVWYSVVVPASGNLKIETQSVTGSAFTDSVVNVFSGSCGSLTSVGCDDDSSTDGNFSLVSLTGQTPGAILLVSVWRYSLGTGTDGQFKVSAYDTTANLGVSEIANTKNNIKVYPNPFSDVLNISDAANVKNVLVSDISGRLVKTIANPSSSLQLGELKQGMYLVTLEMKDGSKQTIKTIKK